MGTPVQTIRCEGDIDHAISSLFKGEEFVPRFFSEQIYTLYLQTILLKIAKEDEKKAKEILKTIAEKLESLSKLK